MGRGAAFPSRRARATRPPAPSGAGVVQPGSASLALGTSGVLFVGGRSLPAESRARGARVLPLPAGRAGTRCRCCSRRRAASRWVTRLVGAASEAALLAEVEAQDRPAAGALLFLPYLSGERTPHNDPAARGVFFGLSPRNRSRGARARRARRRGVRVRRRAAGAARSRRRVARGVGGGRRRAQRALGAESWPRCSIARSSCAREPTWVRRSAPRDSRGSPSRANAPRTCVPRRRSRTWSNPIRRCAITTARRSNAGARSMLACATAFADALAESERGESQ